MLRKTLSMKGNGANLNNQFEIHFSKFKLSFFIHI